MSLRAVIYARYSSDQQKDASIEDQVRVCLDRIQHEGWQYLRTYEDRAMSGASIFRPGYQHLLHDARMRAFDVIVAEGLDRLSRDQEDVAALFKQLKFLGIPLITLAEGEISELHVGLKGTMNALFLKDLAIKTHRGLAGRVLKGRSAGGLSYGYEVVREFSADGERIRGKRAIVEEEAQVVRRIFRDYAAGKSPRHIAQALNREGIPGPSGKAWGPSTLNGNRDRGTGVLNNELYIGRLVWNRLRYAKDPMTGRRVSRPNDSRALTVTEVPELRIIDDALWNAVKARQAQLALGKQPGQGFWDRRRPRYLLSGLLKCGCCGGGYSIISAKLLGCSTARNKGTCSNRLNIRRDTLERIVLDALRENLMDPILFEAFAAAFNDEVKRTRGDDAARRQELDRKLASTNQKIGRLVRAITDGIDAASVREELTTLERLKDSLLVELAAPAKDDKPLIHPKLAEVYRERVRHLEMLLTDDQLGPEAVEAIRSLVSEIVLTPNAGVLEITLNGNLVEMLRLAHADKQKPVLGDEDGLKQVKLVAGAGFEPATFRL
jgi:site-specific DNA recombinase